MGQREILDKQAKLDQDMKSRGIDPALYDGVSNFANDKLLIKNIDPIKREKKE